ncbi:hypothetical protein [Burkholderia gladioli]|uniref:hypothetical protein n=1 Tax=Burkholderia gladioli TaxID=28095 RepID=UPI0011B21EC7|nr:hypothetical protein [Burkholderia gladioli]MDN7805427.1 hypothetical protein [Burkholderia gladioli]
MKLDVRGEAAGRTIFSREETDGPDWDACVDRLLGPVVANDDRERRRADALALAAAAMRAAGEHDPASQGDRFATA